MSNAYRIITIGTYPPEQCGIAIYNYDLFTSISKIKKNHFNSTIIAVNQGIQKHSYPSEVKYIIKRNEVSTYLAAARYINKNKPDLVHIQHENGIYGGNCGNYIITLMEKIKVPFCVTLHALVTNPLPDQKKVIEAMGNLSQSIVVLNSLAVDFLVNIYGVNRRKIIFIPHGIHCLKELACKKFKMPFDVSNKKVLMTFGLITNNKGIEYAIEAMHELVQKYNNLVYVCVGITHPVTNSEKGESYRRKIKSLIKRFNLDKHVYLLDKFLSLEALLACLHKADIHILPYLNKEKIASGSLAYAFSTGKPVISTPFWHAIELLGNGRGIFVSFENSKSIYKAVNDLLRNGKKGQAIGQLAYKYSRGMLWGKAALRYASLFNQLNCTSQRTVY